jgi:acetylornithine deacetylase
VDVLDLLERLVRAPSVNPGMDPDGAGEAGVARILLDELGALGVEAGEHEVLPGRSNVVGVLPGPEGAPTLMLEAHMDTVPEADEPIEVRREGGRLRGRGSCDTKGSLAAMLAAVAALAGEDGPRPAIVFAATVDEESGMKGAERLLEHAPRPDAAVVGEPTSLVPVRVHNGVVRVALVARGRPAHTSKAHLGVNAVSAAARAIAAIEGEVGTGLADRAHPLAGPALLTASMVRGGVAPNVVPERCEVQLDRRLAPGETAEDALAELDAVLERLRAGGDDVRLDAPQIALPPVETPQDDLVVRAAEAAIGTAAAGAPYTTDASRLSGSGGVACVVLGPGSIDQAHTPDEWVPLEEVERAVGLYVALARRFAQSPLQAR